MNKAYILNPDGSSETLSRVHCASEERELQDILEKNLQLIPVVVPGLLKNLRDISATT